MSQLSSLSGGLGNYGTSTDPSAGPDPGDQYTYGGQAYPGQNNSNLAGNASPLLYGTGAAGPGTVGAAGTSPLASGGGALNFGNVPGNYQSAYANALSLNSQNYSNILSGYQGLLGSQQAAQQGVQSRYDSLWPQVQQTIAGIGASQQQQIADTYAQQSGNITQQMTNSGLGNTTAATSAQGVASLNQQKASVALANQIAQLNAGYQSQLGLAGAGYANQANMQNTALGQAQLGFMNSVSAPYPNLKDWQNTAQQRGAANAYRPPQQSNQGMNVPSQAQTPYQAQVAQQQAADQPASPAPSTPYQGYQYSAADAYTDEGGGWSGGGDYGDGGGDGGYSDGGDF
jgi:hypothetical protein